MELQRNKDITRFSAYKTPATAEYFFELSSRDDLKFLRESIELVKGNNLPIVYISGGTNIVFAFDHFPGLVVHIWLTHSNFFQEDGKLFLEGDSGVLLSPLVIKSITDFACPTLLPWVGLPGTIGGAIIGNAGCFWLETSELLVRAEIFNIETWVISWVNNSEMNYSYRSSSLKNNTQFLLLSGVFNLDYSQTENPYTKLSIEEMKKIRKEKQPPWISCGSFFTNPPGESAGKLIDSLWLKWTQIWGIQISPLHWNFFINTGGATWKDIIGITDFVREKVGEKYGIELIAEARIITA